MVYVPPSRMVIGGLGNASLAADRRCRRSAYGGLLDTGSTRVTSNATGVL
jgi:hypothetical protein